MQGKDAYNPDAGYPHLPAQESSVPLAPPPYTDYPQPAYPYPQGNPGHPAQGTPGYPAQGTPGYPAQGTPGYPAHTGYPHPTQVQGPTMVPTATVIVQAVVGPEPTRTVCRSCNKEMTTRTDTRPTMKTHLMAMLLCVLGCWPCVCVPYCMDSCLDTDHYCSKCNAFVGAYSR